MPMNHLINCLKDDERARTDPKSTQMLNHQLQGLALRRQSVSLADQPR